MPCYHPLDAYQAGVGTTLAFRRRSEPAIAFRVRMGSRGRFLRVPCGQCHGCRLERSRQNAVRCMHETQLHDMSSFVTLTFNDENLRQSLERRDIQLFLKRARKRLGRLRYFYCGEYGEQYGRPHFHCLMFGVHFGDRYYWRRSPSGFPLYRSELLESLWTFGDCEIGDVSFESAAYVARYVMKKRTGPMAESHYESYDVHTGEIFQKTPEFVGMSLKPGIGAGWFEKFGKEVYPEDRIRVNDTWAKPPKYYDKLFKEVDPFEFRIVQHHREMEAAKHVEDNTPRRLADREKVSMGRLRFKGRTLE